MPSSHSWGQLGWRMRPPWAWRGAENGPQRRSTPCLASPAGLPRPTSSIVNRPALGACPCRAATAGSRSSLLVAPIRRALNEEPAISGYGPMHRSASTQWTAKVEWSETSPGTSKTSGSYSTTQENVWLLVICRGHTNPGSSSSPDVLFHSGNFHPTSARRERTNPRRGSPRVRARLEFSTSPRHFRTRP